MAEIDLTGLVSGKTYTVMVRAIDADGKTSEYSNMYQFTVPVDGTITSINATVVTALAQRSSKLAGGAVTAGGLNKNAIKATGTLQLADVWNDTASAIAKMTGTANTGAVVVNSTGILGYKIDNTGASGQAQFFLNTADGNAYFRGTIYAGAGLIGGWAIGATSLTAGTGINAVGMNTTGYPFWAGDSNPALAEFSVKSDGTLTATNASITGNITASAGTIGGFTIGSTALTATNIYLDSNNGLALGSASQFKVTQAGALTATNASITGNITASAGTIGGFTIGTSSLTAGTGLSAVGLAPGTYPFYAGDANPANAEFSVDSQGNLKAVSASITGNIVANSGSVGGWSLNSNEIYSGTGSSKISFSSLNGKITIGTGNHGAVDTGFYVDSAGKFSLSNQLIFNPGQGNNTSFSTTGTFTTSAATITVPSGLTIVKGMTVTGTGIDTNTYVTNVSGTTITISKIPLSNQTNTALTFVLDDFAELQVVGRIKGVVESTQIIGSPRLSSSVQTVVVSGTYPNQTATITTSGHAFLANEKILIESLPVTGGLNNLNREFVIASVIDSITLSISISGVSGVTSGTYTGLSAIVSLRELTMGLHPQESVGTTYEHSQGTGIRLDKYNWWFTNNQFRVGTSGAYFKWDGSKFVISGANGTSGYNLQMGIGPIAGTNYYSIVQSGQTPAYNNAATPFYADDTGVFSLGQKLKFDTSGNLFITGSVVATSGTIGGFTIGSTALTATNIYLDSNNGLALGSASQFKVTQAGALTATNASITGNITASGGQFSGNINATGSITGGAIYGASITGGLFKTSNLSHNISIDGSTDAIRLSDINGSELGNIFSGNPALQGFSGYEALFIQGGQIDKSLVGTDPLIALSPNSQAGYILLGADGNLFNNFILMDSSPTVPANSYINIGTPNLSIYGPTYAQGTFVAGGASAYTVSSSANYAKGGGFYTGAAYMTQYNPTSATGNIVIAAYSNVLSTPNRKFYVRSDGAVLADGAYSGAGADYAEYFEWKDGNLNNEDRIGLSVILDGDKIRQATSSDNLNQIIGIISHKPTVIGDAAQEYWQNKYLKDEFGRIINTASNPGELIALINPQFNPDLEYIPRENRKEWTPVGLMGKLPLKKGQPVNPNWIKLKDLSNNVELWLVK